MNPFLITEQTCISFSGGRTSAYMLHKVLEAHDMSLPSNARVLFCNTGKEHESTLDFVHACETNWNVPITWLEYMPDEPRFQVVNYETASRDGKPFQSLIHARQLLPNVRARFCTAELKIRTMSRYTKHLGWGDYSNFIGIRADEPRRVAKMRPDSSRENACMPLAEAGVTKTNVLDFWSKQSFDLQLPVVNGETIGGNCDLCFLKSMPKIMTLVKQEPHRAIWWAKQEEYAETVTAGLGNRFRIDRPKYSDIADYMDKQTDMFDDTIECFCGD
jgi:3'-phosphoadenosine 5'-phosphosulfate sulfotransferase (PAPS reductase)/FAD synthetase